ncbi:MAG TPA: hypothetical protein VGS22_14305 [Thermoanaerobaculia bacterium]|jgi:hypothetical protein|nr:hypothetical protein [Thermoanaerobaculia bacterium]
MKRKLKLYRDTVRHLDALEGVQGGLTQTTCHLLTASCFGTCVPPCTLSPTACVPRACV